METGCGSFVFPPFASARGHGAEVKGAESGRFPLLDFLQLPKAANPKEQILGKRGCSNSSTGLNKSTQVIFGMPHSQDM